MSESLMIILMFLLGIFIIFGVGAFYILSKIPDRQDSKEDDDLQTKR